MVRNQSTEALRRVQRVAWIVSCQKEYQSAKAEELRLHEAARQLACTLVEEAGLLRDGFYLSVPGAAPEDRMWTYGRRLNLLVQEVGGRADAVLTVNDGPREDLKRRLESGDNGEFRLRPDIWSDFRFRNRLNHLVFALDGPLWSAARQASPDAETAWRHLSGGKPAAGLSGDLHRILRAEVDRRPAQVPSQFVPFDVLRHRGDATLTQRLCEYLVSPPPAGLGMTQPAAARVLGMSNWRQVRRALEDLRQKRGANPKPQVQGG